MVVIGNVGSALAKIKRRDGSGEFYSFRLAENLGKGDNRKATWWSVTANISELDADMLTIGMTVKLKGRAEAHPFARLDGTLGSELRVSTNQVDPYTFPTTPGSESGAPPDAGNGH